MPTKRDLVGKLFGRLTVKGENSIRSNGRIRWDCKCLCGNTCTIKGSQLTSGKTQSCGCLHKEQLISRNTDEATLGGDSNTRLYGCWRGMRKRCIGYGCSFLWNNFIEFKEWSLTNGYNDSKILCRGTKEKPDQGNYEPSNCYWGTYSDNANDWRKRDERKI